MKRCNKKRNSALLYEFLIKHISKCLVEGKKTEAQKAVDISKQYFSVGTPLHSELALFNNILKTEVKSKEAAHKIIDAVCEASTRMNVRQLDEQKSKLIKDINYKLKEQSFYDSKIPNYTVYASVQNLLNDARNKKKTLTIADRVKLEENVATFLTREVTVAPNPLKVNPNYNNNVYKFATQRFHKKYEGVLSEAQKRMLTQYSLSLISNKQDALKECVQKEVKRINMSLMGVKDESVKKDGDLMKKLQEVRKRFEAFSTSVLNEQVIVELLQYMKLVDELES